MGPDGTSSKGGTGSSAQLGVASCRCLDLHAGYLEKQGYAVIRSAGASCDLLVVCQDCVADPQVHAWAVGLDVPKLVLGAAPPQAWTQASRVDLPVLPLSLEQRIAAALSSRPVSAGLRRYLLIVVDDDATTRAVATKALEAQGFAVVACEGFGELTGLLLKQRPDFILLDLNLPGFSGERLGEFIHRRGIPVALHSSVSSEELLAAEKKTSAVAAFPKGTSFVSIARSIREYLDAKRDDRR